MEDKLEILQYYNRTQMDPGKINMTLLKMITDNL